MISKRRIRLLVIAIILSLSLLSACRDDDGQEVSAAPTAENTPTIQPTATPTDEPTPTPADTPVPTDTATPEPTDTPTPTDTPDPTPTDTPEPTDTPTPTETPTDVPPTAVPVIETPSSEGSGDNSSGGDFPLPLPSGPPATEWNGIPIMPQAIAGQQGDGSYYFTTNASVLTVQNYYQSQLLNLGWVLFAQTVGQNDAVILIFQHQTTGETLSIAIFTVDANTRYVLLVR